jgi:hypothetical protein
MSQPAEDVAVALATALPSETVIPGLPQRDPDRVVYVVDSGGIPAVMETGGVSLERPRVRVFCRVTPRTRDELPALVESARAALQRTPPAGYARAESLPAAEIRDEFGAGRHVSVFIVDLVTT